MGDSFMLWNVSEQIDYVEDTEDTEITITFSGNNMSVTTTLEDTFIHPLFHSYFYSPRMKTLFIFTADQNDSIMADENYTVIDLVTISWNPSGSIGKEFAADLNDFAYSTQQNVNGQHFVNDAALDTFKMTLDGKKWTNYDEHDMFMVRVASVLPSCSQPEWLRYSFNYQIYKELKELPSNGTATPFEFDYAGNGYKGIDTRIKRAYSFSAHKVWFYEVDDEGFGSFRLNEFDFDHQTLSSYWALMWFLIALVLLCCCCCCIFHIKKKRDKTRRNQERFGGMTAEQEMMTQV